MLLLPLLLHLLEADYGEDEEEKEEDASADGNPQEAHVGGSVQLDACLCDTWWSPGKINRVTCRTR